MDARAEGTAVLSVDLPSGVDATTGVVHGTAVFADRTVTFASPKLGHFLQPGRQHVGALTCADIGIPTKHWVDISAAAARLASDVDLALALPPAPQDAHKGTFGHLLVVAGSPGKGIHGHQRALTLRELCEDLLEVIRIHIPLQ